MDKKKKILIIIIVNLIIVLAEIFFGLVANSYALIADAFHNGSDVLSVIVTYIALVFATKNATFKQTFGFIRAEMMATFINSLFLFVTMLIVLYEAINKLLNPQIIDPNYMIIIGFIALIANSISAYILKNLGIDHASSDEDNFCEEHNYNKHDKNSSTENLNIKSAYLHMLADALISLGVIIAGIFIYLFEIYSIDAILAIIFSIYILKETYELLQTSFLSLMDINIINIDKKTLDDIILKDKIVDSYHDLHLYKPSVKDNFISLHIVFDDENLTLRKIQTVNDTIYNNLKKVGFNHILIQSDLKDMITNHANCIMEA